MFTESDIFAENVTVLLQVFRLPRLSGFFFSSSPSPERLSPA
jgi:hypothetical protein